MTESELKQHIVGLIHEMTEDGATWVDERWDILGDMFEDLWGRCYASIYCHTQRVIASSAPDLATSKAASSMLFMEFAEGGFDWIGARWSRC